MKNELVWRKITDPKSGEKRKWDFRSKGGLWVVLAKFSPTNGIFNKMGLFSENLAIILENGIPFVRERTVIS